MNKVDVNKLGNTSIIRLKNIEKKYNLNVSLYAKNESENPTGSVKDRAVYQMLLDGVNAGTLKEGSTVIEATSGNTGISLAAFGPLFGLKVIIVMPDNMSLKRRELIKGYGAELCLIKGGMKECNEQAQKLVKEALECPDKAEAILSMGVDGFDPYLATAGIPDPDLIVRTSGENRLSNYLLWQSAYSEFLFVDTLWPDFRKEEFFAALESYAKRDRRYGKVK